MNKYCLIENFANDCTTPCLVGDLSPYDFTNALYLAGKNYRIAHSVDPITMEDVETVTESFTSSMDAQELKEETMKTVSEFVPDDCFLNTYLNSNLKFKLEDDTSGEEYQVDIKIVKVSDTDNYRLVCNPHGVASKNEDGYFLKIDTSNGDELILSKEPLYITNNEINVGTTSSSPEAERAADLFNEYNGTAMEVEEFTNQNNMGQLTMNPENTLLFRFWKTFDQKVLINVFDNGRAASGSDTGEKPVNHGYMIYNSTTDNSIRCIDRTKLFPSSLNNQNDAGADRQLINLNYDLLVPYKIPDISLNNKLNTNIKFPDLNGGIEEGKFTLIPYYINDDSLLYIYRCKIQLFGSGTKYGFLIDNNNTNITIVKTNFSSTQLCNSSENILFTFWQTLDKQFIIAKCIENTLLSNCSSPGSNSVNNEINLQDQDYNLVGLNTDGSGELIIVDRFVDTLHFNIDTIQMQVDPVDSFIKYIQELAITRIDALINKQISGQQPSITVPSVDDEDNCNNKTFNFIIFLKILSMCIALFLFSDLDYSENMAIKLFKGFFAMLFSEIYLVYQFLRIVVFGS